MGEKTSAVIGNVMSRSSLGSDGSYNEALKQKSAAIAGAAYEKGGELASGAYQSASYAKHAALDWISSMTNYQKDGSETNKQAC